MNHLNLTHSQARTRRLRGEAETWRLAHSGSGQEQGRSSPGDLAIRIANRQDGSALKRLAQLDGRRPPTVSRLLVAEVDGEVLAALPLDGGEAVADPFRQTSTLVAMLRLRAGQLRPGRTRLTLRARLSRLLRAPAERSPAVPATPGNASMLVSRDGC